MSRIVYRIGTDTPDYEAHDLSGKGAGITGGRWNEKGVAVVYAAESRSLACLETLVHLAAGGLQPLPYRRADVRTKAFGVHIAVKRRCQRRRLVMNLT